MNPASAQPRGGNGKAIVFGILAMILGAGVWALVTVVIEHEFSLVAFGVGALVGLAMYAARPTSMGVAAVAALLAVAGCALGEFLAVPAYVAHKDGLSFSKLLSLEVHHPKIFFDSLSGKTYLFWAMGALTAFSMVFRRIKAARMVTSGAYGVPFAPPQEAYGPTGQPYPPQQPGRPGHQYGPNPEQYGPGQYGPQQDGPGPGPQQQYGQQPGQGQYPPR